VYECAPPIPTRAHPMSFSQAIMDTVIPTTSMGPKFTFTGVKDPEAHLTVFHTQMMLSGGSDVVYCKLFMNTLAGATLDWFFLRPILNVVQRTVPCQQGPPFDLLRCL